MATQSNAYDHPSYTIMRQESKTFGPVTANAVQPALSFRSRVACVVTGIAAILNSVSSNTLILTLFFNGSIAAILTLSNSVNEVAREFTLTANRTLTGLTDRFEVSTAKDKGDVTVVYEYKLVPGASFSLNAALS
jgi:hypothetical protein